jgi:hypothetical protein
MAERSNLRAVHTCRPIITVGQSVIDDGYYVEVTPPRLQQDREFEIRQGAIEHACRLRDLYGWRILDLTQTTVGLS